MFRVKSFLLASVVLLLSGCVGLWTITRFESASELAYQPISNLEGNSKHFFYGLALDKFSELGYQYTRNDVFTTVTTAERELGFHRWKRNNDKWDIRYQLSFQVVEPEAGAIFWKLDTNIIGERSGREPRLFSAPEFDETLRIHEELLSVISALFSEHESS